MKKSDKKDIFYITHKIELLIWLIIVLIIVASLSLFNIYNKKDKSNDYSLFLPDIDGLIIGSPVRIMGIEIGHVIKIKPVNDEVFVKFLITNKDITIPQGTIATVEFSGMAGSKSLELYPPNENSYIEKNMPLIQVNPPKRLHDALGLLSEMFDKIGSIIKTASILGKSITEIDIPQNGGNKNMKDFIDYTDKVLDRSIERTENFEKRFLKNGK